MKNSIKYLLFAAIAAFFFLNIAGKKDNGNIQPTQTMPQIPNGDFEDWTNSGFKGYTINTWKDWSNYGRGGNVRFKFGAITPDSITPFHGKYSALMISGTSMINQFPISVHPSSLHFYLKCPNDKAAAFVKVELLKNTIVVDSAKWNSNYSSIESWTEIIIPISNTTSKVDSARIEIDNWSPKLEVDNLFFK